MAEYIEREDLLELYRMDDPVLNENGHVPLPVIRQNVMDIPAADVAPVRHGRWEMNSDRPDNIICTNCDAGFDVWKHEAKDFNYCPNCGADMRGSNDE